MACKFVLYLWLGVIAADANPQHRIRWWSTSGPPCDQAQAIFDSAAHAVEILGPHDKGVFDLPHKSGWYRLEWREGGELAFMSDGEAYRRRS